MSSTNTLSLVLQSGLPTIFWGGAGMGKTSAIYAVCEALGYDCECIIASIKEPSDFGGLPVVTENGVVYEAPAWAKRIRDSKSKRKVLFFDEISTAAPANQAALLRIILELVVGDIKLGDDVSVIAAANPPEIAAGGWELAPPLANRFCHVNWKLEATEWADGMTTGWPKPQTVNLPADWRDGIAQARALVAAFIRRSPHLLHKMPSEEAARSGAWPSPRTWDMACSALAACKAAGVDPIEMISGCIGEGATIEFMEWQRSLDLPNPEEVLATADTYVFPTRDDILHAVLGSVIAAVASKIDKPRYGNGWKILNRAADKAIDIAGIHAQSLARVGRNAKLPPPKEIIKFSALLTAAGV